MNNNWKFYINNDYGHINSAILRAQNNERNIINATANERHGATVGGWIGSSSHNFVHQATPITRIQAETYWPNLVKSLEGM